MKILIDQTTASKFNREYGYCADEYVTVTLGIELVMKISINKNFDRSNPSIKIKSLIYM